MHHPGPAYVRSGPDPRAWRQSRWLLILIGMLAAASAFAQDVIWIGRPSARDYLALNVQRAVEGYAALRQQMARFEAQVEEARRAYFAASAADRAAAGDIFGELLFQKDLMIAWPRIAAGSGDQAQRFASLMTLGNNGRPLDGGIPPSARKAFNSWVSAVGFGVGSGLGITPDPVKAAAALASSASLKEYEAYRRLRDQAEYDDWEAQRTGAARKLIEPGTAIPARLFFGETPMMRGFDYRVAKPENQILRCMYAGRKEETSLFYFWQGRPPQDIAILLAMNPGGLARLKDHGVDQCPPDDKQARAIESSPAKAIITPEMARDARAQRNSIPLDPIEAQAIQDRNAAARQKMEARKAREDERNAKVLACRETLQAEVLAARQDRDRIANDAARAKYRDCSRNASK
ncbi:hypothetical protein IPU70_10580 [Achromobacter sp. SD115]|uniref:hypothetical protein n=1 Tax=Achromobacter sp. SD115 TaxID=2782011 RepID=UPI001A96854C|nr:hypothetical protein [Achromobacter sp. SD115]MBO1013994.1 hypothetical protein [Achromobacter sp. SD115]